MLNRCSFKCTMCVTERLFLLLLLLLLLLLVLLCVPLWFVFTRVFFFPSEARDQMRDVQLWLEWLLRLCTLWSEKAI